MSAAQRHRQRQRRGIVRAAAQRRAYLALCATLDTPPRTVRLTPRQARRMMRRELQGALA